MKHVRSYLEQTGQIAEQIDADSIDRMVFALGCLSDLTDGRLFIVGLGGSAANASHAAADFRKITSIHATCLSDSVAELTARANDEGWAMMYADALTAQRPKERDCLMVLSVGGGTLEVSRPLIEVIKRAREFGMRVLGIVGRDGGYTKAHGDCVVVVPTVDPERVTPHAEGWQGVVLHCLVSHPSLQVNKTKW